MKRTRKLIVLLFATLMMVFAMAGIASAAKAKAGWSRKSGSIYYYKTNSAGEVVPAEGLTKIGRYTYYFEEGRLVTGWVKLSNRDYRYFQIHGKYKKTKGAMLRNRLHRYNGHYFLSNRSGRTLTGQKTVNGKIYYFGSEAGEGVYGASQSGWIWTHGYLRYFDKTTYQMQVNTTIDGRTVDNKGRYVDKNGNPVTKSTFEAAEAIRLGQNSTTASSGTIVNGKKTILICAGHSRTDAGASGTYKGKTMREEIYTRDFAARIVRLLKASGKVNVVYYRDGTLNTCIYEQIRDAKKSAGISNVYKAKKDDILDALNKYSDLGNIQDYSYILEIHFNATAYASKDPTGNGSYKGVGFYYNSHSHRSVVMEDSIARKIAALGFRYWAQAPCVSNGLTVAACCARLNVPYSLMETAFIDDADDMSFYLEHRNEMAQIVADKIIEYYGA